MVKSNSITPKTSFLCSCCGDLLNPPKTDLPTKYPPTNRPTDALCLTDIKIARHSLCRTQTRLAKCKTLLRSIIQKILDLLASIKNIQ